MPSPSDPPLLALLSSWEPSAPRLTWYGADGERVELSGRVLLNWVIKAANLLSTECGVSDGASVLLDLPAHWRLVVWAIGAEALHAQVHLADRGAAEGDADVVVTDRPQAWSRVADVIAVPLPALARSWPEPLPAGVIDGASELMGQPDVPVFATTTTRAALPPTGERRLLVAHDPASLVAEATACWREGGSVVVVQGGGSLPVARIAEQEGVTPG